MRDAGRIAAAIGVLNEVLEQGRPVRLALKAWGEGARYAGAKDRAFVSGLALDAIRRRRSIGWLMGNESPRALALGVLAHAWGWTPERIGEAAAETPHGPGELSPEEAAALATPRALADAPAPVQGDYPDWMDPHFARVFGEARAEAAAALAQRAPVDLRVNTLKTSPARALEALSPYGARPAGVLEAALRIDAPLAEARAAPVEASPEFEKGWFEVQDLGSQIAAACAGDLKGVQVLDFCAGGGGKTLAFAAAMANTGQIFAYDSDARRLAETVKRARRAGLRNLQVRNPVRTDALADLEARMDVVFVDAPCTGSGSWRRHPDAKWRLRPGQMQRRLEEQDEVLDAAARHVTPGGRLIYATCSLFAEENEDRVAAFLARTSGFAATPVTPPEGIAPTAEGFLRLSPAADGTDGFFVAALTRR